MKKGSLNFIGLGLYDEKDISLKGLEEIKKCDKVFAEFYTAKLFGTSTDKIEELIGKKINTLNREETEKGDILLNSAEKENVCFLVCGDSMTATTHVDLRIRAVEKGIKTKVVHGSSVVTAASGLLGLQNYKFGRTTTLAIPEKNYFPTSPYDVIKNNLEINLHTLVLVDIQSDKNRYMSANEALKVLLQMEEKQKDDIIKPDTIACVVARAGSDNPLVLADQIKNLVSQDFGSPMHSLVIPGKLHFMEIKSLIALAHLPAYLGEKLQKV